MNSHQLMQKIKEGLVTAEDLEKWETGICKKAVEMALRAVPGVVDHLSKQAFLLRKLSTEFYEKNKDLAAHKALVQDIIMQVEGNNPGANYEEVLEMARDKAREVIGKRGLLPDSKGLDLKKIDKQIGAL